MESLDILLVALIVAYNIFVFIANWILLHVFTGGHGGTSFFGALLITINLIIVIAVFTVVV